MGSVYHFLARSENPLARALRRLRRGVQAVSLPAPKVIVKPMLWGYLAARSVYRFGMRVFVCEPLFKAYCKRYGRGLRTDVHIHWVQGKGEIIVGDDVQIDGKCHFHFASRYTDRPTLTIGDHSGLGHGCAIVVGKRVSIGRYCRIASEVQIFDSSGHPSDPAARQAGRPAEPDDVRPITIEDNVWVGSRSIIFPGVTLGEGSIVTTGSVVMSDVPPYTIVAGNPARKVAALRPPAPSVAVEA